MAAMFPHTIRLALSPPTTTVLLVEDDRDERVALSAWLARRGYRVELAHDGCEAIARLSSGRPLPALILLDLGMPRLDGWRVLARIALDPAWRVLPVIVMSGTLDGAEQLELPTIALAPKPLRSETLGPLIDALLGRAAPAVAVKAASADRYGSV
jgi:CheY-like chemotaxis protein